LIRIFGWQAWGISLEQEALMDFEVMNDEQVCELLQISQRTLMNRIYRKDGSTPPYRKIGHQRVWIRSEVIEWLMNLPAHGAPAPRRRRGRPSKAELVAEGRV